MSSVEIFCYSSENNVLSYCAEICKLKKHKRFSLWNAAFANRKLKKFFARKYANSQNNSVGTFNNAVSQTLCM